MSGKAPPRGPRALLNSLGAGGPATAGPSSSQPSPAAPSAPSNTRLGAVPPTGPRSLTNGAAQSFNRNGSKSAVNGRASPANGQPKTNGPSPPTGPSAMQGKLPPKAKQVEIKWSHQAIASSSRLNASEPGPSSHPPRPTTLAAPVAPNARAPGGWSSSFSSVAPPIPTAPRAAKLPPQPSYEPPPPPPPTSEPPPPPPPSVPPPPPPPPSVTPPPPPPPSEPPPPPPPPSVPAPPPPPSSVPPPAPVPPPPLPPGPQPPPPADDAPPPPSSEAPPLPPSAPPPIRIQLPQKPSALIPTAPRLHPPTSKPPPTPPPPPSEPPPPPPPTSKPPSPPPPPPRPPSPPPHPPPPSHPKLYSLPPPPPWPPSRDEYPPGSDFKVLYDPSFEKDRDGKIASLIEKIREAGIDEQEPRLKGKGKGKEILLRYGGQVIEGEPEVVPRDPRKAEGFKRPRPSRAQNSEVIELKYETDAFSMGPPPPTAVLVAGISPLTPKEQIRRHFSVHGPLLVFEPQIDKATGGALGIVFLRYTSHVEALRCVERENGKKMGTGTGLSISNGAGEGQEMKVMLDGERKILGSVLRELDDRRRKERVAKTLKEKGGETVRTSSHSASGQTPSSMGPTPWRGPLHLPIAPHLRVHNGTPSSPVVSTLPAPGPNLPPKPVILSDDQLTRFPGAGPLQPMAAPRVRRPPATLVKARISMAAATPMSSSRPPFPSSSSHSSSSTPLPTRGRNNSFRPSRMVDHYSPNHLVDHYSPNHYSPMQISRSPSPISRKPGQSSRLSQQRQRELVIEELAKNGFDHVKVDGSGGSLGAVTDEDVKEFLKGFDFDKILRDHLGLYISFQTAGTARRAFMVLSTRTLAHHSVTLTVQPPPTSSFVPVKTSWTDAELIEQVEDHVTKELRELLEKDVLERLVGVRLRRLVADQKKTVTKPKVAGEKHGADVPRVPMFEPKSLKGLSFKKANKRVREEAKAAAVEGLPEVHEGLAEKVMDEAEVVERPKKKRKQVQVRVVHEDVESEDEDLTVEERKRDVSMVSEDGEPPKKVRVVDMETEHDLEAAARIKKGLVSKNKSKLARTDAAAAVDKESVDQFVYPDELDFGIPAVTQLRVTPDLGSSLSPPSSPVVKARRLPPRITPAPDVLPEELLDDDEDTFYARLALARSMGHDIEPLLAESAPAPDPDSPPPFRVHVTGSARTEGYYKISHAEKSAYVDQYALRATAADTVEEHQAQQPKQTMTSSRSNRANARRQAQGLEEINQVQRAMALSKGETAAAELSIKFNQLQTRKKHLRFARSPIHDWGLYAMERISRGEMVIEYVGEVIRAQVADKREKAYERQGIGSSYLFRIDEDLVVDATKKGNLGRLINHSCDPNCTAKIITINGEKKIVIYAKQDIELGDEITYDYHFPIEQDKIPCLCGSAKCRGYLN